MAALPAAAAHPPRLAAVPLRAVSESLTVSIAASAADTRAALARVDLATRARRALSALVLDDRIRLDGDVLTWRMGASYVRASWELQVADADDSSRLTVITRLSAGDSEARARLLDAWPMLGPLVAAWACRAARTVKRLAEAQSSSSS